MKVKALLLTCLLSLAAVANAAAEWKTDFEAAKAQARKENKVMLLDFTGSDWCGWCVKMKAESLDKKAFLDFADKNVVLVEVDFPTKKKLSEAQRKANDALKAKYKVAGFPTYVFLDSTGKELGRQEGYLEGGPEALIAKIEKLKKGA